MEDKTLEKNRVYSTLEAAKLLGTSDETIVKEIKKGNIEAVQLGKGWKVLGENLMVFMKSPSLTKVNLDNVPVLEVKK